MPCFPALVLAARLVSAAQAPLSVTHAARAIQPGELVVLSITAPASSAVTVRAFDRDWPVHQSASRTWRSLVGIDLATKPGRHDVLVVSGDARTSYPLVVRTRAFPTRRLKVDPALVTPPPEARDRIAREA